MHYYKFNIADWYLHTAHLSIIEEAVYFRLINHYYNTEKPFNKDETQSLIRRLRLGSELDTVHLILSEFFTLKDDNWFHIRCEKEIKDFKKKAKANKSNGAKGGRPRKDKGLESNPEITQVVSENNPDITLTTNQEPLTTNQEPVIKDICETAFDNFYSAGLVKKSKMAALKKFKALVKEMKCDPMEFAELLKSDIQYRINNNQFGIDKLHPSTYLTQQRWTDEHETANQSNDGFTQGDRKLSASERIAARNHAKYGQPSSGLGVATDGGDLRGTMDQGARRITFDDVEGSS